MSGTSTRAPRASSRPVATRGVRVRRRIARAFERDTRRLARAVGILVPRFRRPLPLDPEESAKAANCRYVDDSLPGLTREKTAKGWKYVRPDGKVVRDLPTLHRIKSLVIPPAWTDVWICASPDGHIQATGRDARRRKQYRYHPRFREIREETKYERMLSFAAALPQIRAEVDKDLSQPGLARDKVLATVVRLLEITLVRVGNEEYARENASFGLTTLRARHADIGSTTIKFAFRGKSGKDHEVKVSDRRLARILARIQDLPGETLFQYEEENGEPCTVESADVNEYLRRISGADFTAKDFRTWAGTVLAAQALSAFAADQAGETQAIAKKNIVLAVKTVSRRLGNTPAVCRRCYVHPEIWAAYMDGQIGAELAQVAGSEGATAQLSRAEAAVLALLHQRITKPESIPASKAA